MEWIRKRARWPRFVALLVLFGLTVTAPQCWRWLRAHRVAAPEPSEASDSAPGELVRIDPPAPTGANFAPALPLVSDKGPALPPVVTPQAAAGPRFAPSSSSLSPASIAEPLLEDDYALVDDPLPASDGGGRQLANQVETMPSMAPLATSGGSLWRQPAASPTAPQPPMAPGAPQAVPAPPAPAESSVDPSQLLALRDAMTSLLEGVRRLQLPAAQNPSPSAPQVRVSSADDRLAMRVVPEPLGTTGDQNSGPAAESTHDKTAAAPAVMTGPLLRIAPTKLTEQLAQVAAPPVSAPWAAEALAALPSFTAADSDLAAADAALADLARLATTGFDEALKLADPAQQRVAIRAARSLSRRLPVWQALVEQRRRGSVVNAALAAPSDADLMPHLHELATLTAGSDAGAAWRNYLLLDQLAAFASAGAADMPDARRTIARQALARLESPKLTPEQREFLTNPSIALLAAALRSWATGPVDMAVLAGLIERYEERGSQRDGDGIAELRARLAYSGDPQQAALADQLDQFYRNGNMRLAITAKFLNRMAPQPEPTNTPIHDRVASVEVRGRARTTTKLAVRLVPDPQHWLFDLQATGAVQSQTYSNTWPARVLNKTKVGYEANKRIQVTRDGLAVDRTAARTVDNRSALVGVDSSLEPVPVVGPLVHNYAMEKNQERRPRAMAQVRAKVTREVRSRMDREADAKIAVLEQQFRSLVVGPLEKVSIAVDPLEMYTTDQRAVVRMRMAGGEQLAAHTPRPSAPGDSLASVQLHESAFNNAARGLGLDGRQFTATELYETLAAKLDRPMAPPAEDFPSRAKVKFAAHDAVRVRCDGDRVELILAIAQLAHGRDRIDNVEVHAFFKPVVDGLELKLVRDGSLRFSGPRLLTGPRIVLHSVFGKMLPKEQEIVLLAPRVEGDPRFAGLMVTQLVIEDGWLALALGPETPARTAWRSETQTAK